LLRQARNDPDVEIARRAALCLEKIDAGPGPELAAAAARLLARHAPDGAVGVLLGYVPFADDLVVEDEVRQALAAVARPAAEETLWQKALADSHPATRGAAAFVLASKGTAEQRSAARLRLRDPDSAVCLRAVEGLLAAHDRQALPTLIRLLAEAPAPVAVTCSSRWPARRRRACPSSTPSTRATPAAGARGRRGCPARGQRWTSHACPSMTVRWA
jgi:hypothetical protein